MGLGDDIAYVAILVGSIGLGPLLRLVPPEENGGGRTFVKRKRLSTLLGLVIATLVSGWHVVHLLIQALGNMVILKSLSPRICHLVSLFWCFTYLMFFRLSARFGLPSPPPHTNAVIMILTLKLIGLAFEVHDSEKETTDSTANDNLDNSKGDTSNLSKRRSSTVPSLEDQFHYGFNHVGLITGPYYKFSTWKGTTNDPWNPAVVPRPGLCSSAAWARAARVPAYVTAFLISGYLFPMANAENAEWHSEHGVLYKILYMVPIFFNFRMRIYAGFTLSEVSCIMAGLGAYPSSSKPRPGQGPTIKPVQWSEGEEVNFEAVHNIDEWGADFVPSMREALRCWNMTVQHWLVLVVYKRFPVKALRTTMVMIVSSVWHGVHPGYYLGLGSVPLCLAVEDLWRVKIRSRLSEDAQYWYDWVAWCVRMRWFDYLGMAFLLLKIDTIMMYWTSVFFVGHVSLPILAGLALAIAPVIPKRPKVQEGPSEDLGASPENLSAESFKSNQGEESKPEKESKKQA